MSAPHDLIERSPRLRRDRGCLGVMQGIPARFREFGVERQDFNGKRHLVGDALTGGLTFRPKFKVFWSVICALPVDVVHLFVRTHGATKDTGHDFPVFEDRLTLAIDGDWANDSSITSRGYVSSGLSAKKPSCRKAASVSVATRLRAEALFTHICAGMRLSRFFVDVLVATHGRVSAAFFANEAGGGGISGVGSRAPALARTVQRITAPYLAVRADSRSWVAERTATIGARKLDCLNHGAYIISRAYHACKATCSPQVTLAGI